MFMPLVYRLGQRTEALSLLLSSVEDIVERSRHCPRDC